MKVKSLLLVVFLLGAIISKAQTWPLPGGSETVPTSAFGPRNIDDGNKELPWAPGTTVDYTYDFHGGLDMASLGFSGGVLFGTSAPVHAIESGTIVDISSSSPNSYVVIESNVNGNTVLWKYLHINHNYTQANVTNQTFVNAGDQIGEVLQWPGDNNRSHLDIRYYPGAPVPVPTNYWHRVDETYNPVHRLQYNFDSKNFITNSSWDDDKDFGVVLNQTDFYKPDYPFEEESFNSNELEKEGNFFTDATGDYIFIGIRTDGNELDFKDFTINAYGYEKLGGTIFEPFSPDNDIIHADNSANDLWPTYPDYYLFDSYAHETNINYDLLKRNVGDMDGGTHDGNFCTGPQDGFMSHVSQGCDRYDNGEAEFNDIEVIPRNFSSSDPYHTVYLKFYLNQTHISNSNYEFLRFDIEIKNTDGGTFSNSTGDLDVKSLYIFEDASFDFFNITLDEGDKAVIVNSLTLGTGSNFTANNGSAVYLNKKANHATRTELVVENGANFTINTDAVLLLDEYTYFGGFEGFIFGDIIRARYSEVNADFNGKIVIHGNFVMDTEGQCLMTTSGGIVEIKGDLIISNGSFLLSNENPGQYIVTGDIIASGAGRASTGYVLDFLPGTIVTMGYNDKIIIEDGSKMRALGSANNPVRFTYLYPSEYPDGGWDKIEMRGDGNIFRHSVFEYGVNPLYFRSDDNIVEYSNIKNNLSYGVRTSSDYSGGWGSVKITDSRIENNGSHGVYVRDSYVGIEYSDIKNNSGDGVHVYNGDLGFPYNGGGYFRGNEISGNGSNAVQVAYNGRVHDGFDGYDGNNILGENTSHEVYLSSSNAEWWDARGGGYTAVIDQNSSTDFVYNLAQTTSGESTVSWTVGMENYAWNYLNPYSMSHKFYGSVDYDPYQTGQMFNDVGPRGSVPSSYNPDQFEFGPVLSQSQARDLTSEMDSDPDRDFVLEANQELRRLLAKLERNPNAEDVPRTMLGISRYYNALSEDQKQEFPNALSTIGSFKNEAHLVGIPMKMRTQERLASEMAFMLEAHQAVQDGNPQTALDLIGAHGQVVTHLDIAREVGFIKAWALEQTGAYLQAIKVYEELEELTKRGIDPRNSAQLFTDEIAHLQERINETSGAEAVVEFAEEAHEEATEVIPMEFKLHNAYPNPFNPSTVFNFDLPESGMVNIQVFDVNGRLISVLANTVYQKGTHSLVFDATHLASGVYFVQAELAGTLQTQKVTLIK